MSLLRRIEGARPATPATPQAPTPAAPGGPGEAPPAAHTAPVAPKDSMRDLRNNLQNKIINNLDPRLDLKDEKAVKSAIEEMFNKFLEEDGVTITRVERQRLLEQIFNEVLGFGPIQPL